MDLIRHKSNCWSQQSRPTELEMCSGFGQMCKYGQIKAIVHFQVKHKVDQRAQGHSGQSNIICEVENVIIIIF